MDDFHFKIIVNYGFIIITNLTMVKIIDLFHYFLKFIYLVILYNLS